MTCHGTSTYYGQQVKAAPADCFHLKTYIVGGQPCYTCCATPLTNGLADPTAFITKLQATTKTYQDQMGIPTNQKVVYQLVTDNIADIGGVKGVSMTRE